MYELIQAGERTYYINCPAKMGIYRTDGNGVYLIDSGNDKEAGKKLLKIINENNWELLAIVNTHSNADHVGGNRLLQERTGCKIISTGIENAFAQYPVLEPSFLYGGYPCKELRNKFLMAEPSAPTGTVETALPKGLEYIRLGGHFFDMIGIRTSDNVCFLGDCVFGENIISKYHLSFIYDVREFLNTLDMVEQLECRLFVPAHAEAAEDIRPLVQVNRDKVYEIIDVLLEICKTPLCFEDILKEIFDRYSLNMDFGQYVLVGSTVRSYLSYLHDEKRLDANFVQNKLLWKTVE
ncbi:MBL fold metallo-hydrolase [Hydrogenoanaerobacterium sp.]|uniref:MBL fold metallo-hydrolase n=1 Tax=Hydrogenoanaerobacterium sp. TaxID=2953763 RepID=UPI0028977BE0|nr:MBL fold metallo-hydrolase [Hydrogenoanaerobacterium sp.]